MSTISDSKAGFVLNCFRQLLDDGQPHRYREILEYVREQAIGTPYEGGIEPNNLVVPISKKLKDPAFPYARTSFGFYQKAEPRSVAQESVMRQVPSIYDLLDNMFTVQRQMDAIHQAQREQFPESESLETAFQTVSEHMETLLDCMSMWVADMEDQVQELADEPESDGISEMQLG